MSERKDSRHDSPKSPSSSDSMRCRLRPRSSPSRYSRVRPHRVPNPRHRKRNSVAPAGRITVALRTDPKTLNPILAVDTTSREVIGAMQADLVHINRQTQRTEPALASSWKVSPDGRKYTLALRRDVKFSDGAPFTADDVVFTFQLYLDESLNSPQRDLLVIDNKPITVKKIDNETVEFDLTKPYGPGERIFDSLAILPKHLLEAAYRDKKIGEIWGVNAKPEEIAGLGPFRLKSYVAGQQLVLERNPNYWRKDSSGTQPPLSQRIAFHRRRQRRCASHQI